MDASKVIIKYMPEITDEQLWDFYIRNSICEAGHGKEVAVKPLKFNPYIVGAFYEDKLVGIIRALFDGVSATIMESGLEVALQGDNLQYENGSIIEMDKFGIFQRMGLMLIDELRKIGNTFITAYIVDGCEESSYHSIGLKLNQGHSVFIKDERPYVS